MQDASHFDDSALDASLAGLNKAVWKSRMINLVEAHGEYHPLGQRHFATYLAGKPTLLVTFESIQGIQALSENAHPMGFDMVRSQGWSHLCLISDGDTWFRNSRVYGYFDQLIDDGFFDQFERVLFFGAGPCGYAASAFSVAAPGATVLAIQPQATLDPRMTEWDPRFTEFRRTSFTDRFGYAPDMLDAADQAFVLYDPRQDLDAMHAALFRRPNVTRLRLPHMGSALQTSLIEMDILYRLLLLAGTGRLTPHFFSQLYRERRTNVGYLRALMARLDNEDRPALVAMLCRNVTGRMRAPKFRRRLDAVEKEHNDR
ncbi:MAG: phosphoadenosine phosphosulfate reductase [Sedimentitalea sp.]